MIRWLVDQEKLCLGIHHARKFYKALLASRECDERVVCCFVVDLKISKGCHNQILYIVVAVFRKILHGCGVEV